MFYRSKAACAESESSAGSAGIARSRLQRILLCDRLAAPGRTRELDAQALGKSSLDLLDRLLGEAPPASGRGR